MFALQPGFLGLQYSLQLSARLSVHLSTGAEQHVDGRRFRHIHDRLLEAIPSALVSVLLFPMVLSPFLGETTDG